ncbi:RagB/SusD family nutrient uptake outer membrane protein [Flaviaesturariibacter aridisoli]|nr:RagB/SusD family nutrient uptake outer membrane protein [Flaviaesturariibacter aridisoli]
MKSNLHKFLYGAALATVVAGGTSCKKDFTDPSAISAAQAFTTPASITGVAVSLQRVYTAGRASSLYNKVVIDGLLTRQDSILNAGNIPENQLWLGGGNVDATNTMLAGLWTSSNKIVFDANNVIAGARNLGDRNYGSGLIAYATLFKALAVGDMATFWEQVPTGTGQSISFQTRAAALTSILSEIDGALAAMTANAPSAAVLANLPAGIDLPNSLQALKARYSLMLGNYQAALTAANAVDLTKKSVFSFSLVNPNPIWETVTSTNNVVAATPYLGLPASLPADPADKRLPFYLQNTSISATAGFAATNITSWPIYLPGEITLIKAEAYARMNPPDLNSALTELNKVITKQRSVDPFGVGAELPAVNLTTQQAILDEIYRQRAIELTQSGLRLEDMRRFNRPLAERKRNFLPYPFQERDNNPNTPPDPQF